MPRRMTDSAVHQSTLDTRIDAPFCDPFLSRWVNAQLGGFERRAILRLSIETTAAQNSRCKTDAAEAADLLERLADQVMAQGGRIVETVATRRVAVWGVTQSEEADCRRALDAALAVARDGGETTRVLLDVRFALVSRASPFDAITEPDTDPVYWEYAMRALPPGVVISQAFRRIAGLERGLVAISMANLGPDSDGSVVYVLPATAAAALDQLISQPTAADAASDRLDGLSPAYMAQLSRIDALADLKPVITAAAIAGMTFSASVLAEMLGIEEGRLDAALRHAEAAQLIRRSAIALSAGTAKSPVYSFLDGALQRVAYTLVPEDDRRRLHGLAAHALTRVGAAGGGGPEQVAQHHRSAANAGQSKRWLGKAAWAAIEGGKTAQAIEYLETALAQQSGGEDNEYSQRHLLQLLGVQIALARGNASEDFFDLYQRSLEESWTVSHDQRKGSEFRALWGLQSYHLVRGEIHAAMTMGRVLLMRFAATYRDDSADGRRGNSHYKLLTHRMQGLAVMLNGQLGEAEQHYDTVLDIYDMERDAPLRFAFGSDQAAVAFAHRSWTRTLRGQVAGAKADAARARRHAERLAHAHTSAHVMGVLSLAALQSGSLPEAALTARETRAIASENGLSYWIAWADVVLAAAQAQRPADQVRAMAAACARYKAQNAQQLLAMAYGSLGEIALSGGMVDDAREAVETGLTLAQRGGVIVQRPHLKLIQARVLRALGDRAGAAACREAAYEEAKRFGTALFLKQITLDGCTHSSGQDQILWQRRYHATA